MKNIKLIKSGFLIALAAIVLSTVITSCSKDKDVDPTIAQVAVSMQGFSQLEAAAIRGGVAGVLSEKNLAPNSGGNYTVFAPTNEAFAKLGLVNPQDLKSLRNLRFLRQLNSESFFPKFDAA